MSDEAPTVFGVLWGPVLGSEEVFVRLDRDGGEPANPCRYVRWTSLHGWEERYDDGDWTPIATSDPPR